jgi:hypothetical protein
MVTVKIRLNAIESIERDVSDEVADLAVEYIPEMLSMYRRTGQHVTDPEHLADGVLRLMEIAVIQGRWRYEAVTRREQLAKWRAVDASVRRAAAAPRAAHPLIREAQEMMSAPVIRPIGSRYDPLLELRRQARELAATNPDPDSF